MANIVFVISLLAPNIILLDTSEQRFWSQFAALMIPLGFYAIWCALSRRAGIMVWLSLPFIILAAFQLVLLDLFSGSAIESNMFTNILTTNYTEASELLGNIYPAVIAVCMIYVPQLWFAAYEIAHGERLHPAYIHHMQGTGAMALIAGIVSLIPAFMVSDGREPLRDDIFPANVLNNALLSSREYRYISDFDEISANFQYDATRENSSTEREIYVYIIGEASRAHNWQLYGYGRQTNPQLAKRNDLVVFDKILTQSNATHKSVPMMLSSAPITNHDEIYHRRGLAELFNEIGIRTCFISNQSPNRAMIDNLAIEADIAIYIHNPRYDMQLIEQMQRQIERFTDNDMLFILHCYGSHFSYRQRYPSQFALFQPDNEAPISRENIEQLTNAYDNSILYTDHVIASTIDYLESLKDCSSALIYCADHGEDLFDDTRERFLHSAPMTTYYQLHVASLAWFSESYRAHHPEKCNATRQNARHVATTRSMFHTIADIASIESCYIDRSLSLANQQFDSLAPHYYLNDHNCAVSFLSTGLSKEDIRLFQQRGIDLR